MLIDKRVDPRTPDTVEWGDLTTETKVCAEFANLAGRYGIRTTQFFNPVEIDVYVGLSETELTRITSGDPSPTEFYADGGSGYVLVNAVHVGEDIRADYYPGGTILTAEVLGSDDFKGPQGDTGATGAQGPQGDPGDITTNLLTGFVAGPNSAIVAGDTVLQAFEKAQGQLNAAAGDVATQTVAASAKTTPVDADVLPIADSEASNVLKKLTFANFFLWIISKIAALASKTTPVDADSLLIIDSEASNVGKRLTFTNLKAFLKTYFDTVYGAKLVRAEWRADGHAGYGSSATKIPYYSNVRVNNDAAGAMTVVNNATDGCKVTITSAGWYSVTTSFTPTDGSGVGVSLNSSQLTTDIGSITAADRLTMGNSVNSGCVTCSITLYLAANDVIRPHHSGVVTSFAAIAGFSICRVG